MSHVPRSIAALALALALGGLGASGCNCGSDDIRASSGATSSGTASSATGTGGGGAGGAGAGATGGGGSPCAPPQVLPIACADLTDGPASAWSFTADDDAPTTLAPMPGGPSGQLIAVDTQAGFGFHVRYDAPSPIDASSAGVLQLAVRAGNVHDWQVNSPVVMIEDASSAQRTYSPTKQLFPSDGITWRIIEVPLAGGPGWDVSGAALDLAKVQAVTVSTDTWDYGFQLDLDAVTFKPAGAVCAATCPNDCSGRGTCDVGALRCRCALGATNDDCSACGEGFVAESGACVLADDGAFDTWPNPVSATNGDPWLAVHHDAITTLKPRVLVLHFPNPSDPAQASIVGDVVAGFADGSRYHAYADAGAAAQLQYQIAKTVDLRDGVGGRPPAPAGWPFENSTLFPRKGSPGSYALDYAALFSPAFAALYGFPDPASPGQYLDLCALIDGGVVNEVWMVASQDVAADAAPYEVLELKQRYTPENNKIPGSFERCAANGCFPDDVQACGRSVRIGFINHTRGPGCYMHSQGHGLESAAGHAVVPALTDWFLPFAAFDLDTRYGLPFPNLYGLGCASPPCVAYPAPSKAVFTWQGQALPRDPFDARCGSVHFPPNGRQDYDYAGPDPVLSSCEAFGENAIACGVDQPAMVRADLWSSYDALHGDCGGGFLTWWYQSMPAHGAHKALPDGRPMQSVWPFLFY
jgi:hypothetical protein